MKTWIKIKLTKLELENFKNHVNKFKASETKFINNLIMTTNHINKRSLETGTELKTFHIDNSLVNILDNLAKIYTISRNLTLRYLINNLEIIEYKSKEDLDTDISFYINKKDKEKITELMKSKHTTLSLTIRQIFDNLDLIPLKDFDNDLDSRMKIQVSSNFKIEFRAKANDLGFSNSQLARSIIHALI